MQSLDWSVSCIHVKAHVNVISGLVALVGECLHHALKHSVFNSLCGAKTAQLTVRLAMVKVQRCSTLITEARWQLLSADPNDKHTFYVYEGKCS